MRMAVTSLLGCSAVQYLLPLQHSSDHCHHHHQRGLQLGSCPAWPHQPMRCSAVAAALHHQHTQQQQHDSMGGCCVPPAGSSPPQQQQQLLGHHHHHPLPTPAAAAGGARAATSPAPAPMPSLGWSGGFHSAFQLGEVVGSGSFGTVHRAVHRHTGAAYAVKVLPKVCGLRGTQLDAIRREVHTWRAAQGSPFVVRLEGVYEDEGHAYLVQELCAGGSLKERLAASDSGVVSEAEAAAIMRGVLDLLAECHKQAIVYGDLKPANIMFSTAASGDATQQQQQQAATAAVGGVRAIDFGCSHMGVRGRATRFTTACGSPLFMAPEVALEWYGVGADMWSAGMMLYQMLTGRLPFWPSKTLEQVAALPGYQLLAAIRTHEVQFPRALWRGISVQARELVSRMLERDPAARITAAQALQHPWLASALGAPSSSSSSSSSSSAGSDAGSDSSSSSSRANNVVPLSRSSSSGAQLSPRQGAAGAPGPLSPQRPSPLRSMLSGELAPPTDMHRAPSMQRVPSMSVLAPAPE